MAKKRSDGEGSVYQRHGAACPPAVGGKRPTHKCTGPWVGVLVTGYRDGKPIRKKVSGRSQNAAAANLRELRERIGADELPDKKALTVEDWMTYWYGKVLPRYAKPHTLAGYNAKVNHYILPLLGHYRLDRLTPEHIEDAWEQLRSVGNPTLDDPKPLSANTIHQTHRILARALKVAVQRKKLRLNPASADSMDAPRRDEREVRPMTADEVDKVLAASEGTWNAARWHVALAVGLRQGEALGLRWEDVDLDAGTLAVRQTLMRVTGKGIVFGTPKSAKSRRTIALPDTLAADLRAHRKDQAEKRLESGSHWTDSGLIFTLDDGRPIDPSVDAKRWKRLLEVAGVPHYRLHDARHSAGTIMLEKGVDLRVAMAILGHSQISVTMRYQHAVDATLRDAASKIDSRFAR